jgi:ABC-type Fe3+-hydroxamate transport system substrate-binding protein
VSHSNRVGRPRCAIFGLAATALLAGWGCDREAPDPPPRDPRAATAARVVTLSPLAARFVVAIGARARLVGADPASTALPALAGLTAVDLDRAAALAPDLVLVAAAPEPGNAGAAALARGGSQLVEFAPHDLEDVAALVREVGAKLVGAEAAGRFEAAYSRPLAKIGAESRGEPRPRVVAVVSFDPLVIAGGHSFETDLIEIAGGRSVTHPGVEPRLAIGADRWRELAPDLVLVIAPPPETEPGVRAVRNALPPGADLAFYSFDPTFWIDASDEPARRLRGEIAPIAARMAARQRGGLE